jgi:type I restriction enzyme S subunit
MAQPTNSNVPNIRFKGFEGDWDEMPMGRLLTFKNGYNGSKSQYGRGEKFINVLDIIRNDYITYDRIIGRVSISPKEFGKNEVVFGDILFQRCSETLEEVGQANVYLDKDRSATFGGFVIRGRPLVEFNPAFFNATLKSAKSRRDITSRSGGSTRYNIGQESLEASLVSVAPDLLEQGRIADFVMSVDRLIRLQQRKHEKLVMLKKGMLQKMFPQPGTTTPEVRFKGFLGDWIEKHLSEISERIVRKNSNLESLRPLTISAIDGLVDQTEYFSKRVASRDVSSYFLVKQGEFAYNKSSSEGFPFGAVRRLDRYPSGVLSTLYIVFAPNISKVCSEFLVTTFATDLWHAQISNLAAEGARNHGLLNIKADDFFTLRLAIPRSLKEQRKIGTYFRTLDGLISKRALQLEKLKQIKSACLEKMFV